MGINPGELDREITFQVASKEQDEDTGEEVITWENEEVPTWAQWLPADTREAFQARQRLASYIDGVFKIYNKVPRPMPDTHRIVFESRTYDCKPAVEIGRGDGLLIPVVARGESL